MVASWFSEHFGKQIEPFPLRGELASWSPPAHGVASTMTQYQRSMQSIRMDAPKLARWP
jgi:hypothetical protein